MTDEEKATAEKAEKERKEKAEKEAADAVAKAAKEAEEAAKKEKQFWTDTAASLSARVSDVEKKQPSASWLALVVIALILGGFSVVTILLTFFAAVARRVQSGNTTKGAA